MAIIVLQNVSADETMQAILTSREKFEVARKLLKVGTEIGFVREITELEEK